MSGFALSRRSATIAARSKTASPISRLDGPALDLAEWPGVVGIPETVHGSRAAHSATTNHDSMAKLRVNIAQSNQDGPRLRSGR
jgi:predicted nicotinamide N-methyase